jgi:hypothetical protein
MISQVLLLTAATIARKVERCSATLLFRAVEQDRQALDCAGLTAVL